MTSLYDKDFKFIKMLSTASDIVVTKDLTTGYQTAAFNLPYSEKGVTLEQKVIIDNYVYVIKEINMQSTDYYSLFCKPFFDKLAGKYIDIINGLGYNIKDCFNEIIYQTDWTVEYKDKIVGCFNINIMNTTALDAIAALKDLYQVDLWFDTLNKKIIIWNTKGKNLGVQAFDEQNLDKCTMQSNSYDLVTKLIPLGKDNLTIHAINGDIKVTNNQQTNDMIVKVWRNSSTVLADDLYDLALYQIDRDSRPQITYKILSESLTFDVELGDFITIWNKIQNTREEVRINKIVDNTQSKELSYIECGSRTVSFDDIYKDLKDGQSIVNDDMLRNLTELNKSYTPYVPTSSYSVELESEAPAEE